MNDSANQRASSDDLDPDSFDSKAFPKHLAKLVFERWQNMVAGDYKAPPCPPEPQLCELLEIAYLASMSPEEARFPKFNIAALPSTAGRGIKQFENAWPFVESRPLTVGELRRLAPAVDVRKSAIWVGWQAEALHVMGLVDLGTSWHRARVGLEYRYRSPSCLFVQIDGPGRIRVYQGAFRVAELLHGQIIAPRGVDLHLSLHEVVNAGLRAMRDRIVNPSVEQVREWAEFEFIALWNTIASIANSISLTGHGGALVVVPPGKSLSEESFRIKYRLDSGALGAAFIGFINARNELADLMARRDQGERIDAGQLSGADLVVRDKFDLLVEATRFVSHLAGCDGAIVLSGDLSLLGFGCELRAPFLEGTQVYEVVQELGRKHHPLDLEDFGMRHRSAVKLVSQEPDCRVLVISQDGPVSAIWADGKTVLVRKNLNLVNANMPWA